MFEKSKRFFRNKFVRIGKADIDFEVMEKVSDEVRETEANVNNDFIL